MGGEMEFLSIKKDCNQKIRIGGNTECTHRRKLIGGLDGCLCRPDNCFKLFCKITMIKKTICPILFKIALEMGTYDFTEKYGGFLCPLNKNTSQQAVQVGGLTQCPNCCLGGAWEVNEKCAECGYTAAT